MAIHRFRKSRAREQETPADRELASSIRSDLEAHARAIRGLLENTTKNVIQIGLRLEFVRNRIGRDRFQAWLRSEFQWSQPVASNYMAAARAFSELDCVGKFQPSALFILARKNVPKAARDEAVRAARRGELITKSRALAIVFNHGKGVERRKTATGERIRRYLKNVLKTLPEDAANEVLSELLGIIEELRADQSVSMPAPSTNSESPTPNPTTKNFA